MHSREIADNGLTLLKKGKQGMIHALFGRGGLLILCMLVQAVILFGAFFWFEDNLFHLYRRQRLVYRVHYLVSGKQLYGPYGKGHLAGDHYDPAGVRLHILSVDPE